MNGFFEELDINKNSSHTNSKINLIKIFIYKRWNGKAPFYQWLRALPKLVKKLVFARLNRIRLGNFGDYKILQGSLREIRIAFGKGYRMYGGLLNKGSFGILCAGDKSTQVKDIKLAKALWFTIRERTIYA